MAEYDFGYLEGDHLGRPRDLGLLRRLYPFLRPRLGLVGAASALIMVLIALELAMPYVTRLAIDRRLTPHYLRLDLSRLPPDLGAELDAALGRDGRVELGHARWVAKRAWRELDPALTTQVRQSGAVGPREWYGAPADQAGRDLARGHPAWFSTAGGLVLIPVERLDGLDRAELGVLRGRDAVGLGLWAAAFAALAVLLLTVSFFQTMTLERAGQGMVLDLRLALYQNILARPMAFFHENPVGKLVTRTNNDIQNLAELFRGLLVGLFRDLFLAVGVAGVMLALDWRLALLCLALAPLVAFLAWRLSFLAREIFRRVQGQIGRINTLLSEMVSGISQIKLLNAERPLIARLGRLNQEHFRAGMTQVRLFAVFLPLVELLGALAVALIIWRGGGWVIQDRLSLGTLVAFISYFAMFLAPIRDLAEKYHMLQGALASAERILVLMDQPEPEPEAADAREAAEDSTGNGPSGGDLRFERVGFGYRPDQPVLSGFDLAIPQGQFTALVGPSGSGKSTLVNLVLRLYEPWSGRILLDGREVGRMSRAELTRRVALVGQETVLVRGSVARNVSLDRPRVTPSRLAEALEISGAAAWVNELPDGIDTMVGQGGRRLSQGQRQMLALARALAGDPWVLILDEAFSQVDPASEQAIQQALPRVMAGRTTLLVAHRLSTARRAERILVMKNGRLVEDGDHAALLAAGGLYADMVGLEDMGD